MAEQRKISDQALIDLAGITYGNRETLLFYARKAKSAGDQARLNILAQNPLGLSANSLQMIESIDMMLKLLGDDNKPLNK